MWGIAWGRDREKVSNSMGRDREKVSNSMGER